MEVSGKVHMKTWTYSNLDILLVVPLFFRSFFFNLGLILICLVDSVFWGQGL